MVNIVQSALQQALGAMDKYVTNPIVNGGVQAVRGIQNLGNRIKSAQDQAYQEYWSQRPHEMISPLASPTPNPTDVRMQQQGYTKNPDGSYSRKDPKTGFVSTMRFGPTTIKNTGVKMPQGDIKNTGVQMPNNIDSFKFTMGQKQYPNAKAQIAAMYQKRGNPPMAQYVDQFVASGEKYGVDPRILAIISQVESSGGVHYPAQTYNPFGYLGGTGSTVNEKLNAGFTSIPHAIDALTRRFATRYPDFIKNPTPSQLQASYNATPSERQRYLEIMSQLIPDIQ